MNVERVMPDRPVWDPVDQADVDQIDGFGPPWLI